MKMTASYAALYNYIGDAMQSLISRFLRENSGIAMTEAIIAIPVILLLLVGGFEFGRLITTHASAEKTMRNAARYLAMVPETGVCTWGLTNARNLAMFGTISPGNGTQPLIAGWTQPNSITLTAPACGNFDNPTVIRLSASIQQDFPLLGVIRLLRPESSIATSYTIFVWHEERHIGS